MNDIRNDCPIKCLAHEVTAYSCDKTICIKRMAYIQGRTDGKYSEIKRVLENYKKMSRTSFADWLESEIGEFE